MATDYLRPPPLERVSSHRIASESKSTVTIKREPSAFVQKGGPSVWSSSSSTLPTRIPPKQPLNAAPKTSPSSRTPSLSLPTRIPPKQPLNAAPKTSPPSRTPSLSRPRSQPQTSSSQSRLQLPLPDKNPATPHTQTPSVSKSQSKPVTLLRASSKSNSQTKPTQTVSSKAPASKLTRLPSREQMIAAAHRIRTKAEAKERLQLIARGIRKIATKIRYKQACISRICDERKELEKMWKLPVTPIWTNDDGEPQDYDEH